MKPPWAASIWADSDFVYMELPSPMPDVTTPQVVKFVNDAIGLAQALRVLDARRRDFPSATISTTGAPTNLQIVADRALRAVPKRPSIATNPALRDAAKALIRKMGLV